MARPPKVLDDATKAHLYDKMRSSQRKYQKEYRQRPGVKAKQREYHRKYRQYPEVKAKLREKYQRKALERARAKVALLEATLKKENSE